MYFNHLKEVDHLEDPRRRWEDNIKLHLQEVGCAGVNWIDLPQDRDK